MAFIREINDVEGNIIYPMTVSGAVATSSTTTLNDTLSTMLRSNGHATNTVLTTDSSGVVVDDSGVTTTELGYLSGVTSEIQPQLNGKQSKLERWNLRLTFTNGLSVESNGKVVFANAFEANTDYDGNVIPAIPANAKIVSAYIAQYGGYYSSLAVTCNPGDSGNVYLCGLPSTNLATIIGSSVGSVITWARVIVYYTI